MTSHPSRQDRGAPVNWLELPDDVCASIISRLHVVEIMTSVQYVCPKWRSICRDPSMWRSIHCFHYSGNSNVLYDLSKLYQFAVDLSSGGLLDLNMDFSPDRQKDNSLLRYIIDRSKHLRRIHLGYFMHILEPEMLEIAGKLPLLEELDVSYHEFSSEVVAAVGRQCPRLRSFKFNAPSSGLSSDDEAFAIAKNMRGLRQLQIIGNPLSNVGLIAILDGCQDLESLDLRDCLCVNLDECLMRRCSGQIKDFRHPKDSIDDHLRDLNEYEVRAMKWQV